MDSIEMAGIEERRWTQHGVERKRNFKQYACDKNIFAGYKEIAPENKWDVRNVERNDYEIPAPPMTVSCRTHAVKRTNSLRRHDDDEMVNSM